MKNENSSPSNTLMRKFREHYEANKWYMLKMYHLSNMN